MNSFVIYGIFIRHAYRAKVNILAIIHRGGWTKTAEAYNTVFEYIQQGMELDLQAGRNHFNIFFHMKLLLPLFI
jgi:hypothetical protein